MLLVQSYGTNGTLYTLPALSYGYGYSPIQNYPTGYRTQREPRTLLVPQAVQLARASASALPRPGHGPQQPQRAGKKSAGRQNGQGKPLPRLFARKQNTTKRGSTACRAVMPEKSRGSPFHAAPTGRSLLDTLWSSVGGTSDVASNVGATGSLQLRALCGRLIEGECLSRHPLEILDVGLHD